MSNCKTSSNKVNEECTPAEHHLKFFILHSVLFSSLFCAKKSDEKILSRKRVSLFLLGVVVSGTDLNVHDQVILNFETTIYRNAQHQNIINTAKFSFKLLKPSKLSAIIKTFNFRIIRHILTSCW